MTSSAPAPPEESAPPAPAPSRGISRRALLTAGLGSAAVLAAGSGISAWMGSGGPTATPRRVTPLWSELAYRSFGVVSHPTFQDTGYRYAEEWLTALDDLGVHYFRGAYADHLPLVQTTITGARARGLQWGMVVCNDLDTPPEVVERRIDDIVRNAADLCLFIEGINEPNDSARGAAIRADWPERTVALQRTIYEAVRSHPELDGIQVIGPSLHAVKANEADYDRLAELGLGEVLDVVGLHSYPSGHYPSQGLDQRIAPIRSHFPDAGVWLTETGYNNAVGDTGGVGPTPVPEEVVASYAAPAVLEAVDRGLPITWYEVLDDPDPDRTDVQSNFGLFAVEDSGAPPWRPKPAVTALRSFLAELRDPGAAYRPEPVTLTVTSPAEDVRWTALGKRDGSTWLHLRRSSDVWDPTGRTPVTVDPVRVTIVSPSGRRTVEVGPQVVSLRV